MACHLEASWSLGTNRSASLNNCTPGKGKDQRSTKSMPLTENPGRFTSISDSIRLISQIRYSSLMETLHSKRSFHYELLLLYIEPPFANPRWYMRHSSGGRVSYATPLRRTPCYTQQNLIGISVISVHDHWLRRSNETDDAVRAFSSRTVTVQRLPLGGEWLLHRLCHPRP